MISSRPLVFTGFPFVRYLFSSFACVVRSFAFVFHPFPWLFVRLRLLRSFAFVFCVLFRSVACLPTLACLFMSRVFV